MPQPVSVRIIRSRRKTIALQVASVDLVIVRAPMTMPTVAIQEFLRKNEGWIEKHLALSRAREQEKQQVRKLTEAEIRTLKKQARSVIPARAAYFAKLIGVSYGKISIRCQKTRWGSCSAKGDLSFNCLVAHELCHRKHMNHSPRFYAEVLRVCPEYRTHQKWLKEHGETIMAMAADAR